MKEKKKKNQNPEPLKKKKKKPCKLGSYLFIYVQRDYK